MRFNRKQKPEEFDYLADIKKYHQLYIQPRGGKAVGCPEREIQILENSSDFELPLAYKQYLNWMGKDYSGAFVGSNCFITDIEANNEIVADLLAENKVKFQLPAHYLCYFTHQGYMAAWFELPKQNDNPPVWFYNETMTSKQPVIEGDFTEVLFRDMQSLYPQK